jgi:hypothetical protein
MVKITNPVFNDVMELIGEILEQDKKRKKKKIMTHAASAYPKGPSQQARLPVVRAPLIAPAAPAAPLPLEMPVRRRGRPAGQPKKRRRTRAEMEMAALNELANTIAKRQTAEAEELAVQELALKAAPKKVKTKAQAKAEAKAEAEQKRAALERAEWEAFVPEGSPYKLAKAKARANKANEARIVGSPEPAAKAPAAKSTKTPAAKAATTPAAEAKESELIFGDGRFLGRYLGRFN